MPFRALRDGELVVPARVANQEPVRCTECGETMYARGGDKRARHFYHVDSSAGKACPLPSSGESAIHARCVALAVAKLQETFGSQAARCAAEVELDVSESGSGNRTRRADALVEFTEENPFFGNGLIIEVQHAHHEKDIRTTTHDYLSVGYSVVWLISDDFGEEELDYSIVEKAFASEDRAGASVRNYSPTQFIGCKSYSYRGEHTWRTVPGYVLTCEEDYEICVSRGCTLRRQYDEASERYVYNSDAITCPDLPLRVLQDTIVERDRVDVLEKLTDRYQEAVLEKALADRPEIDQCPGPKGFHEWGASRSLSDGFAKVELFCCQHCSVHLLTNMRGQDRTDLFFSDVPNPEWDLLSLEGDPRQCQNEWHEEGVKFKYRPDSGEWEKDECCPDCGVSKL